MSTAEQIIAEVVREHTPMHDSGPFGDDPWTGCAGKDCADWPGGDDEAFATHVAAHVLAALTNAGKTIVERGLLNQATISLDSAALIVDNHASMLAKLVMDTPKDQELTDRLVELARNSAQNIRSAAARVAEGGEQP